jgi:hypothetical protein
MSDHAAALRDVDADGGAADQLRHRFRAVPVRYVLSTQGDEGLDAADDKTVVV